MLDFAQGVYIHYEIIILDKYKDIKNNIYLNYYGTI